MPCKFLQLYTTSDKVGVMCTLEDDDFKHKRVTCELVCMICPNLAEEKKKRKPRIKVAKVLAGGSESIV